MNISAINCDEDLIRILSSKFTIVDDPNSNIPVFINWLSENDKVKENIVLQIEFLERAVKEKRKILIFDKDLSLQDDHISYLLRKKNVVLCEPAINHRREFLWLPHPIETSEDPPLRTQKKNYDIYVPAGNFSAKSVLEKIQEEFPETTAGNNYEECKFYPIFYTLRNTLFGYLEPINYLLKAYCLSVIYMRHRFYHYLFKDMIINNINDAKWFTHSLKFTDYGLLKSFYNRVNTNFPEMRSENWLSQVEELLS